MPITRSAQKALRQSYRRQIRNLRKKEVYKKTIKDLKKLVAAGNKKESETLIPKLYQALDKAAKAGVIKWNKAARLKSRTIRYLQKNKRSPI